MKPIDVNNKIGPQYYRLSSSVIECTDTAFWWSIFQKTQFDAIDLITNAIDQETENA